MSNLFAQPVGGATYNYGYQYPAYGYPQGPSLGDQITNTVDQFTRSITDSSNDMQRSMRRMQRAWNGEPEYSIPRLASWGGGAAMLLSICNSSMRNGPTGLAALAVLGVGAIAGNWLYDQFMDRFGMHFGW
jgi:hypothetical protein